MNTTNTTSEITPLWGRLPSFFTYPFKKQPLILAIVISCFILLSSYTFLGGFAVIISIATTFKYSFSILENTSEGILDAPELSYEVLAQNYEVPLKFLGIYIFLFVIAGVAANIGGVFLATIVFFIGVASLPACIMLLGLTHSFFDAVNPSKIVNMIMKTGGSYLVLFGLLFFLSIAHKNAQDVILSNSSGLLIGVILQVVSLYFTFIAFNMMGYLLYQNHKAIGESDPELRVVYDEGSGSEISELFDSMMAEGKTEAAMLEFDFAVKQNLEDIHLRSKYHHFLITEGFKDQMVKHGRGYISELITTGNSKVAANVVLDCLKQDPDFFLAKEEEYLPVAKNLNNRGSNEAVIKLVSKFQKNHTDSKRGPELYLLAAKVLSELMQDGKAVKILEYTLQKYPNHELIKEVIAYRELLKGL